MKRYAAHTTKGKVATHKNSFPKRKRSETLGDDLRVGETKVIRMDARGARKACCECYKDTGEINVVLTRGQNLRKGVQSFASKNYCDRCLPARYENMRDEAMAPKRF